MGFLDKFKKKTDKQKQEEWEQRKIEWENREKLSQRIVESYPEKYPQKIVRIDEALSDHLHIFNSDILEIIGKKNTVVKCFRLWPEYEHKGIILIDGISQHNLQVEKGDTVTIKKIRTKDADKIFLKPIAEKYHPIDERYIADELQNLPLIKGDKVRVRDILFEVVGMVPTFDAVMVVENTIFHVMDNIDRTLDRNRTP